jgi:hypothetical protein
MLINIEEYELKDNESNYTTGIQLALYGNMIYKQTFSPTETYDLDVVSLRMAMFNTKDSATSLKITVIVTNTITHETSEFVGVPEGYALQHGLLPWIHFPLKKSVHFESGQIGEIQISSEGGYDYVNGEVKGKSSVFYVRRDPLTYLRGALYRYQYWNKTWMKMVFRNKPYVATFKLWAKPQIESTEPEVLSLCPNCGFVFPLDNTVMPAP